MIALVFAALIAVATAVGGPVLTASVVNNQVVITCAACTTLCVGPTKGSPCDFASGAALDWDTTIAVCGGRTGGSSSRDIIFSVTNYQAGTTDIALNVWLVTVTANQYTDTQSVTVTLIDPALATATFTMSTTIAIGAVGPFHLGDAVPFTVTADNCGSYLIGYGNANLIYGAYTAPLGLTDVTGGSPAISGCVYTATFSNLWVPMGWLNTDGTPPTSVDLSVTSMVGLFTKKRSTLQNAMALESRTSIFFTAPSSKARTVPMTAFVAVAAFAAVCCAAAVALSVFLVTKRVSTISA